MMKRLARLGILGVLGLAALLPVARPAGAVEQITLKYWRHSYVPAVDLDKKIAAQFSQRYPQIKVDISSLGGTDQLHQKLLVAFAGGGAPDIVNTYNGYFPQYAALGFLQPILAPVFGVSSSEGVVAQWLKGTLDGWKYQGHYYGIPSEVSSYITVISPKLFRAAGLDPVKDAPKTWEDIAAVGAKLAKVKNGALVQQGYGITSYPVVMALVFDAMIHQLGGSIVSSDGAHATINSRAGVKVLRTLSDFVNKSKISVLAGKPLQGPGFDTGTSAIISDVGLWYRGYLAKAAPKVYSRGAGLKFLPFPRFKGGKNLSGALYGFAWTVSARSAHSKEAWEFVKFLSDHSTAGYLDLGIIQPKAAMLQNRKAMSNPDVALALKELGTGGAYATLPDQVNTIIYAAVTRTILDKVDPKVSLDQAAQELNSLLPTLSYKLSL